MKKNMTSGVILGAILLLGATFGYADWSQKGEVLYNVNCRKCHGRLETSTRIGATVKEIAFAYNKNFGGKKLFLHLTRTQAQAIADALNADVLQFPVTPADQYEAYCQDCHGLPKTTAIKGKSGADAKKVIYSSRHMSNLVFLTDQELDAIAAYLRDLQ